MVMNIGVKKPYRLSEFRPFTIDNRVIHAEKKPYCNNVYVKVNNTLNNHQLKLVGLSYGLEVPIRIDLTMHLCCPQSSVLSNCA